MKKIAIAVDFGHASKLYETIAISEKEARSLVWDFLGDDRDMIESMELIEQADTEETPNPHTPITDRVKETTYDAIDLWFRALTGPTKEVL